MLEPNQSITQFVIIEVAERLWAVAIADVREIVLMAELSKAWNPAPECAGFLNVAGEAIPVLTLSLILDRKDREAGLYSHILLARHGSQTVGFLTQSVRKILSVTNDSITPPAGDSLESFAQGMIRDGKDFISILSLGSILMRHATSRSSEAAASAAPSLSPSFVKEAS